MTKQVPNGHLFNAIAGATQDTSLQDYIRQDAGLAYCPLTQAGDSHGRQANFEYDGRLSAINNALGSTTLSNFGYNYDAVGNITNWTIQQGSSSQTWDLTSPQSYDSLDQLSAAVLKDAQGDSTNYDWNYDAAGNQILAQVGGDSITAQANSLNQITRFDSTLPVTFTGTTSIPALVTVNGAAANTTTAKYFGAPIRLSDGSNTVTVHAVSASGVSKTAGYFINTIKALKYDANGNMTTDGVWDFAWDADDRLVGIKPANAAVAGDALKTWDFAYDGFGRRIQMITRKGAGAAETRRFVWEGSRIAEEKDGQSNLLKRYFGQGVQVVSGDKPGLYYYTRDHLGSIRELTDATGALRARYSYDLWGKRTKISGDLDADFGYTGYWELENGLKLTWYRAYSAGLGKWLSRDPIEEKGGLNLYGYAGNRPTRFTDSKGEFIGVDDAAYIALLIYVATELAPAVYENMGAVIEGSEELMAIAEDPQIYYELVKNAADAMQDSLERCPGESADQSTVNPTPEPGPTPTPPPVDDNDWDDSSNSNSQDSGSDSTGSSFPPSPNPVPSSDL